MNPVIISFLVGSILFSFIRISAQTQDKILKVEMINSRTKQLIKHAELQYYYPSDNIISLDGGNGAKSILLSPDQALKDCAAIQMSFLHKNYYKPCWIKGSCDNIITLSATKKTRIKHYLFGVGLTILAGGTYYYIRSDQAYRDHKNFDNTFSVRQQALDDSNRYQSIAGVLLGIGGGSFAVGTILKINNPKPKCKNER